MTDNRQLAPMNEGGRDIAAPAESSSFLQMILQAASDPTVDAAKVESMANLAIKLQDRERESQFGRDFAAALMEMPYVSKRGTIVIPGKDGKPAREQGKFALFEDLDKVVRPILAAHNLVISFRLGNDGGQTTATPILTHRNGYRDIGDALRVPPDTSGSKNAAQAIGSSSQYAKRYAMCAALNIVTVGEDTDGRSYPLPDDPLTDRQQRLIAEAEASAGNGDFADWYGRQLPKDRAWLVAMGVHARLGGGQALPSREAQREPEPAQAAIQEDPEARADLDRYKRGLKGAKINSREALQAYQTRSGEWLAWLRDNHPSLHQEALDANSARFQELAAAEGAGDDGGLFPG